MMRVQVTVRLHDEVFEATSLPLVDGLRLGEHPDAAVAFPGLDLVLREVDGHLCVRDHRLADGEGITFSAGDIDVEVVALQSVRLARTPLWRGDIALPVLILATLAGSLSLETASAVLSAKADVSEGMVRRVEALLVPPDAAPPEPDPAFRIPRRAPGPWDTPSARYIDQSAEPVQAPQTDTDGDPAVP